MVGSIACCCASAVIGHAAALPSKVMNSRRVNWLLQARDYLVDQNRKR
jgi:hypothetical protein